MPIQGWFAVWLIVGAEAVMAVLLLRSAIRRPLDFFVILVLAGLLLRPFHYSFAGDVSRYLPKALFSHGVEGKDQIAVASAATALLAPLIMAAAGLCALRWIWRATGSAG
jgi:hypothetical protein